MDWEPCSHCLQNKRTSELSVSADHLRHQGCTDFLQISHPFALSCLSCNRYIKCKPWRRKILTNHCSKWTYLLSAVPFMTLLLLLTNISQQVFLILSRTILMMKNSRLTSHWSFLFIALFGGISSLPFASCQESLQPTPSVKSLQLPNMVVHVGSSFIYNISEKAFDCEVENFVVSETADRFLSHWLAYNSNKKQLYGVPSEKDQGTYNILVVALAKDGGVGGHVCGSRSFFISVVPVGEELPVSVYPGTETSSSNLKSVQSLTCVPGTQVVQGTLILNADMHSLNGHERMTLLLKIADHLKVHTSKVSFFSGQASHPIIGQLDDAAVMAAGAGDGRFTKGSRSLLTWHIGCGAIKLEDLAFSKLETNAQDGTISTLLGVPVVGWHIMSGTQRNMARRRVRRQVLGVTATPLASSAPPSRMSNISTSFIVSSTVTLTSMVSSNSTMQLSTTAASSVGPNTTVSSVSSSSISVNSTVSSLSPSRTDIQSSSIVNLTSSVTVFLPSSVKKSLVVNSSTPSVESSTLVSSINRTSLIMQSSVLSPTLNSTFVTKTVATILSSSVTPSSSIVVSLNETTAFVSSSSTVLSVRTSSLNLTLTSSMSQVSSSVMTSRSSLAVSSSRPTLVPSLNSTSLLRSSSSVFLPSSLVVLPNATAVVNASTPRLNSTTALNQTSVTPMLTASSTVVPTFSPVVLSLNSTVPISSTVIPTLSSIERSVIKTSSSVPPILNSSNIMLSSSLILPSSTSSSMKINMTSVIRNTSASLQTNVTSTTVVLSSLTSSPLATTANLTSTSVVILLNSSTTKRTALVNSTSIIDRSSFVTSAFSPTGTSESQAFRSSFATNRTVIAATSVGVGKSSVNITASPVLSTKSLSTAPVTSMLPSSKFSTDFRSVIASNSSFVTPSSTSSEVRMNSTAVSRTQEFSTLSTIVSTKLVSVNSTFLLPSSSKLFPNSSLLVTSILSTSKPSSVLKSSSLMSSSDVVSSSSVFTKRSSVLNTTSRLTTAIFSSSGSVMASSETVSLTRSSPAFNSSLFTSSVISQTLMTSFATSRTLKSSASVQNSTTVPRTSGDISSSFGTLVSSFSLVQRSSTIRFNSSTTELPTSATGTPTLTGGILTSSRIRNSTMLSSPSSSVTPVFTRSTLQTDVGTSKSTRTVVRSTITPHSSSRFFSSGIPSSAQPSATVTPVNITVANSMKTSGTLSSFSSGLPSSNTTQPVTPTDPTVAFSVTPSSTVIVPTTAPPNNPPRLYNNMGRVSAPAGKALYFTIPDDTFYDTEDRATTRNLSLSVSLANGTSIPSDFWLQFDNTSQAIYGLPLSAHVPSGVIGEGFILRARDSRGAEALDAFEVLVVPSEKPVVQELRIRITNDFRSFNRNVSQRLLLLTKIAAYYDDPDRSRIRVLDFISGSVIMIWTNDSLPTDRCDEERLNYVANKVLLPDGQVREEFQDALQGFPVESASQQRMGVCNGTEPDKDTPITPAAQSKQEEDLWYKHVLVGVFIVLIVIVLAVLLIWYCRRRRPKPSSEKRTFRKRKPIVLEPEIELKPIPGKPLFLPHDDPGLPPSYISETSLDNPVYSDEDEVDYGKRSPSVVYEPPPPFHAALADDPRNSLPPVYLMPPMY